ncbi:DUF7006 family protein [Enterococcus sp. OL5]|uniref:DUF7006 family protein n=1 Tax=Enterococcus sp. OL5 TaxID=2590214 RepID=UPI00112D49DC|nr:hypothetical protein [Enterococcus sp. OL5]TPR55073.1 hypothetical protein FJU10_18770 [Enterococcus sp. OL5]
MNAQNYTTSWEDKLQPFFNRYILIEDYSRQLFKDLEKLVANISQETFWEIFPKLLGIDARLALLSELVELIEEVDLSPQELISWVEKDYTSYNKELCGYNLTSKTNQSFIFCVS